MAPRTSSNHCSSTGGLESAKSSWSDKVALQKEQDQRSQPWKQIFAKTAVNQNHNEIEDFAVYDQMRVQDNGG